MSEQKVERLPELMARLDEYHQEQSEESYAHYIRPCRIFYAYPRISKAVAALLEFIQRSCICKGHGEIPAAACSSCQLLASLDQEDHKP